MSFDLRERLRKERPELYACFLSFVDSITPTLKSIETVFPNYTRHDPGHNEKIEAIAGMLLSDDAFQALTGEDLFVLLTSLWLHDAGMGVIPKIQQKEMASHEYRRRRADDERLGLPEEKTWQDYVRSYHHKFCPRIAEALLGDKVTKFLIHIVGAVSQSHGERTIHQREHWPSRTAVGDGAYVHSPVLAAILRISDILHFNEARAPEYMQEHRQLLNQESELHWRAHQTAADIRIAHKTCYVDGVAQDDEAFWFARQFTDAMAEELSYVQRQVLPGLESPFSDCIRFQQVHNNILASGFLVDRHPVRVRVEPEVLLNDLLSTSLYGGKPAWFRELLQNAFDACRDLNDLEPEAQPRICILIDSQAATIAIVDNGIGMRRSTVERFLLVAGASYWRSNEYLASRGPGRKHVGQFGIGFVSVLAVASEILITTRYRGEDAGHSFTVRSARRTVRVEESRQAPSGTAVRVTIEKEAFARFDFHELLQMFAPLPEFPVLLQVDGSTVASLAAAEQPDDGGGYVLERQSTDAIDLEVASGRLERRGLKIYWAFPKYRSDTLGVFLPFLASGLQSKGWTVKGESVTSFGGIRYPQLHALSGEGVKTRIPSLGVLRLIVSPQEYPLEMNLAREQFLQGPGCAALIRDVVDVLDEAWTDDCRGAMEDIKDPAIRSAIMASYSHAMLHLFLGGADEFGLIANTTRRSEPEPPSPWRRITALFSENIRIGLVDRKLKLEYLSIAQAVERGMTLFALGGTAQGPSTSVIDAVTQYDEAARFLYVLPWYDLGIKHLRFWAATQHLVPVPGHNRCALGLTLTKSDRPFLYAPGKGDWFSLGSCEGPPELAILDYRDFMSEAVTTMMQSGGPTIHGLFNCRNIKASRVLSAVADAGSPFALSGSLRQSWRAVVEALRLGTGKIFKRDSRRTLAATLTTFSRNLASAGYLGEQIEFTPNDFPSYFDNEVVVPFGKPAVERLIMQMGRELNRLDTLYPELS